MLIAFEGTGPYDDDEYTKQMAGSFCRQIWRGTADATYIEGPGNAGMTLGGRIQRAVELIKNFYFDVVPGIGGAPSLVPKLGQHTKPLFLTGYSRGGAAAIALADLLAKGFVSSPGMSGKQIDPVFRSTPSPDRNDTLGALSRRAMPKSFGAKFHMDYVKYTVNVEAMFLFDPVNRDMLLPDPGISPIVRHCYCLLRDQKIENGGISAPYSRWWMGNSNVARQGGGALTAGPFVIKGASHGAAGGTPWVERAADEDATNRAGAWMSQHLNKHGISVKLRNLYKFNKPTTPEPPPEKEKGLHRVGNIF